jgi:hypothetical protein
MGVHALMPLTACVLVFLFVNVWHRLHLQTQWADMAMLTTQRVCGGLGQRSVYWLSWFTVNMVIVFMSSMVTVVFGYAFQFPNFVNTNFGVSGPCMRTPRPTRLHLHGHIYMHRHGHI